MDGLQKKTTANHTYIKKNHTKIGGQLRIIENETEPTNWNFSQKKNFWKKFFFYLLIITLFLIISIGIFFFWKIYSTSKKIIIEDQPTSFIKEMASAAISLIPSQRISLNGEDRGRINILLLGMAGENKPGNNLTDTIILASIDTQSKKTSLLSLPRDLYVELPELSINAKINSLYQIGLKNNQGANLIKKAVTEVTGQPIDYYLIVDFEGFIKFIDTLKGITVEVKRDIYDSSYPGPNYSYETFDLKKGVQILDGVTALKYVRERHDDPEGDFGRAKRQQQVLQAIKNKAFTLETFLSTTTLNDLFTALEKNIRTDATLTEMESFLFLFKKLDTQNISTKVIDAWKKDSLLKVSHIFIGENRVFILVPKIGTYQQIHDLAKNIFDIQKIEKRKEEFVKENPTLKIINESGDINLSQKVISILQDSFANTLSISIAQTINSNYQREKTELVDNTKGRKIFSLDEILSTSSATLSFSPSEDSSLTKTDFTLYLGKDLIDLFKYEEVSKEDYDQKNDRSDFFEE